MENKNLEDKSEELIKDKALTEKGVVVEEEKQKPSPEATIAQKLEKNVEVIETLPMDDTIDYAPAEKEGKKGSKKLAIFLCVVLGVVAIAGGVWFYLQRSTGAMEKALAGEYIYSGITIDGTDVGGMTKEEAIGLLTQTSEAGGNNKEIVLKRGDLTWGVLYETLDVKKDIEGAVEEAYNIARGKETLKERFEIYNQVKQNGVDVTASVSYDENKLVTLIEEIDAEASVEATDSTMRREQGSFIIEDEKVGFKLDKESLKEQIVAMVNAYEVGDIILTGEETQPKITAEMNAKCTDLLGTFYTKYTGKDSLDRNINLQVGSDYINGSIIAPGEVFSMNEGLGSQTFAGGYKNAAVIVNGKIEDGIAGGVCQVTTTMYNAVVLAELEIVERKNHSLAIGYVPLGQDAAVAGTYKDLKFKNSTPYPVYLEAYAENGKLVTSVYGFESRSLGRRVELENVYITSIPKPPEKVKEDPELPEGERVVTFKGTKGHKVSTYKKVYENDELLSREWFNDSVYSAVADEVSVGTGPKKEEPIPEGAVPGLDPSASGQVEESSQPETIETENEVAAENNQDNVTIE